MSQRYQLIEDDEPFGMKAGDILVCGPYWLDPDCKLTVLRREADGYDPECNVYRCQVALVSVGDALEAIHCDCGCGPVSSRQKALP